MVSDEARRRPSSASFAPAASKPRRDDRDRRPARLTKLPRRDSAHYLDRSEYRPVDSSLSRVDSRQMTAESVPTPPRRLTDPQTMRALSHPVRLALLEVLTLRGPLTATQAAELIGETPTTCSFHLRQLARYGFVEEAGRGAGRSRPWRVVTIGFSYGGGGDDPAGEIAGDRLAGLTLRRQLDHHAQWRQDRRSLPERWRRVGGHSETVWWVTPEEATELDEQIRALVMRYRDRLGDPAARPKGAAAVEFVALTHLLPLDDSPPPDAADPDADADTTVKR